MDFSPIIDEMVKAFGWLLPLIIVIGLLKSSSVKGYFGELIVRLLARFMLDQKTYHRVYNVTLCTPDGTTQIDHVFVSRFGLFVVETKNMRGWIFGSEHQPQWTQKIYKQSFKFQNPLRQNFKHTKALEATLQISSDKIHSVVVFIGDSTFKTEMPPNVTHSAAFISYIKSFNEPVFTQSEVGSLFRRIESGRLAPTIATHREHVRNLKNRSNPEANRRCPKCGNQLVIRTMKKGERAGEQFWDCSGYPKCRIMQNVG